MNGSKVMAAHLGHQAAPSARPDLAELVSAALRSRRKVFLLGFELRYPLDMPMPDDDGSVEAFLNTLDYKFGSEGLDLDPRNVWLRPQEAGKKPCFRCVLALNGGRLGSPYGARVIVKEAWSMALGLRREPNYGLVGHARFGDEGGLMLWRDDMRLDAKLKDCVAWMERGHV